MLKIQTFYNRIQLIGKNKFRNQYNQQYENQQKKKSEGAAVTNQYGDERHPGICGDHYCDDPPNDDFLHDDYVYHELMARMLNC